MVWNPYALPEFLVGVILFCLGAIVFTRNPKAYINQVFAIFCITCSLWLIGFGCLYLAGDIKTAELWCKIVYTGVSFTSALFYHFTRAFLKIQKEKFFLVFVYMCSCIFLYLSWSGLLLDEPYKYFWGYFPRAGRFHPVFMFYLFVVSARTIFLQYKFLRKKRAQGGIEFRRIQYVFVAFLIGNGVLENFLPTYGVPIYPFAQAFMAVLFAVIGYSIVKYRLMEISAVITRTTIFIFVYSIVLGFPFLVAFFLQDLLKGYFDSMWWMVPLFLMTFLATVGPFIYLAIQKRAEEKLFQDQRRYQGTLRQAATGMGRIKDMERLIGLIVHIVTRSVRIEQSVVFLKDRSGKKYTFEGGRWRHQKVWKIKDLDARLPFIRALSKTKQPLVYSELMQEMATNPSDHLKLVLEQMKTLEAELIVPSFVDENLIAFMVLGPRVSGELYTDDDIAVFSILASQAALAIENCQFYRDMRSTHEQLFKAEKMATIGIMADGLSHQINNRLHALGFIAGDALDTLHLNKDLPMSEELKEVMVDLEHALNRIQENVMQGGEIVRGLLKYSRKQDEKFSEVDIGELVEEAFKMAQFKIKKDSMDLVQNFPSNLPRIQGNFTELQEVFFNLFDNAYDAMMQRKEELQEEGYRPTIEISAEPRGSRWLNIILKDNGMGIKPEDQHKVFTPFFTTKLSSKKGTGLGLYVIRKLIEENHKGKVVYRSEYMKGTRVYVALPACGLANV